MAEMKFEIQKHLTFAKMCSKCLPHQYQSQDVNHLTLIYFVLGTMDILEQPNLGFKEPEKDLKALIDYIYSLQLPETGGFTGSHCCTTSRTTQTKIYETMSIANTYVALAILRMAGDDLSKVEKDKLTHSLTLLQKSDGSFSSAFLPDEQGECDMRFLFCACAISAMINDWRGIDKQKAINYILSSQNFDGAFGQGPMQESHGGSTYCAISALSLMNSLDVIGTTKTELLIRWLTSRQVTGFQGRLGKDPDSCYSFWIGASLTMLGKYNQTVNIEQLKSFVLSCQFERMGGFAKYPDNLPDVLHTYMSLSGLSLAGFEGLAKIDCRIGITKRAFGNWSF